MKKEELKKVLASSQKIGEGVMKDAEVVALAAESLRNGVGDSAYIASALEIIHERLTRSAVDMEEKVDMEIESLIEAAEIQAEAEATA